MTTTRRNLLCLPLLGLLPARRPAGLRDMHGEPPFTRLVLGGDVMLSRHVGRLARAHKDPAWPFRALSAFLSGADIAFVNLETPFDRTGKRVESGMIFKAEPEMVEGLVLAGVDVVSTANNHARDRGPQGLLHTLELLRARGIAVAGTGRTVEETRAGAVVERKGCRFGFLAYTYDQSNGNHPALDARVAMLDRERVREDVAAMRRRADAVVVSMHAGAEYRSKPSGEQVAFARAAIEAGAAVVAGHHPHVVQPAEPYRDGVIFYSLGNLVFDQFQRRETQQGLLAEVVFLGWRIHQVRLLRVDIDRTVPRLAGRPVPLEQAASLFDGPAAGRVAQTPAESGEPAPISVRRAAG